MADEQELPAYPIRAYQLIPDPNQPTVVALAKWSGLALGKHLIG